MARLGLIFAELETAQHYDNLQRRLLLRGFREDKNLSAFDLLSDEEFYDIYRLNKSVASNLIDELDPYLPSVRSTSIPVEIKVLTALAFYAQGSYQRSVGQCVQHKMAQQSVSNCIRQVTDALNTPHMRNKYIKFPLTQRHRDRIKKGFNEKFGFPNVLGCIDSTHIAIVRPEYYRERYLNWKNYHSLNTQIIADSDLNILSVDASYGGFCHESQVWEHHPLRNYMEELQETDRCWFLGDSGYSQRRWMMTPIPVSCPNTPEYHYNELHKNAFNTVKLTINDLKTRWRCLLVQRMLHYDPGRAGEITNACVVLHNIANAAGLHIPYKWHLNQEEKAKEQSYQIVEDYTAEMASDGENILLDEGRSARAGVVDSLWVRNGNK